MHNFPGHDITYHPRTYDAWKERDTVIIVLVRGGRVSPTVKVVGNALNRRRSGTTKRSLITFYHDVSLLLGDYQPRPPYSHFILPRRRYTSLQQDTAIIVDILYTHTGIREYEHIYWAIYRGTSEVLHKFMPF